jgi:hypothetical protein
MMSSSLDFGYSFEPPAPAGYPVHRRLTVVLRPRPTERHYDPERAEWPVVSPHGELDRLTVFHPWPVSSEQRAALGRIILADRKGKAVEAFSFGGTLRITASDEQVVAVLESPAPILPLLPPQTVAEALVDEIEILLARRRAHWDSQPQPHAAAAFEERLARAEPLALYQACLAALRAQLAATPAAFHDAEHHLAGFVRREIAALEQAGHWSLHPLSLEDLL